MSHGDHIIVHIVIVNCLEAYVHHQSCCESENARWLQEIKTESKLVETEEKIDTGEFVTPFMQYGDTVEIEMFKDGASLFGRIVQTVVDPR